MASGHTSDPQGVAEAATQITEVSPNPQGVRFGCDCRDKVCSDNNVCACMLSGEACTRDCLCSDYDHIAAETRMLAALESDDDGDELSEPEEFPEPTCDNKFNGLSEFCSHLDMQPTFCFANYVGKRSKSLAREDAESGQVGYGKTLALLFGTFLGARMPPNSDAITKQHLIRVMLISPTGPFFERMPVLKRWREEWEASMRPFGDLHDYSMLRLLKIGIDKQYSYVTGISYCFCRNRFQRTKDVRYCWHCRRCQDKSSWHCGTCNKCVLDWRFPCTGCGGVSQSFGKDSRLTSSDEEIEEIMAEDSRIRYADLMDVRPLNERLAALRRACEL